jgi:hypothetical protein
MRRRLFLIAALVTISFPLAVSAEVRFVKWDKPHGGKRSLVVAFDLAARKVLWEAHPGKSVNFVEETKTGVLVGTDDGTVVLLNRGDGTIAWKCLLDKKGEINRFHGETENGFLISSGDERFWLVGHDGSVLMRCVDQCLMQ